MVGAVLCFGGAAATLSRGAVLAMAAGAALFVALRVLARRSDLERSKRPILIGLLNLGVLGAGALALGAGQLVERFKADDVSTDVRLRLWRDSLHVLRAHPIGIGRGAFDRVFPVYRTLAMPYPLRFAFVECEPLQLLIDCGWLFGAVLLAAAGLVTFLIIRLGRRDKIEAALVSGAFAVVVHNCVDFGLETLGVLLPFAMVLGTILGRIHEPNGRTAVRSGARWAVVAAAMATGLFGIVSAASASADDLDALLKRPMTVDARRALLDRAQRTHPLDYFYPLEKARIDPLIGPPGMPSPRLHDLNRALRLCPLCEPIHREVARNLWRIGRRQQALLEWRTTLQLQSPLLQEIMGELLSAGATAQEMSAVVMAHPNGLPELAWFLSARGRSQDAFTVLDQADALGAPRAEVLLTRARLQLNGGEAQADSAAQSIAALRTMAIQDPRLAVMEAQLALLQHGADGADGALAILDQAAGQYPADISVQTTRLGLVQKFKRWRALDRSLEGYRQALYRNYGSATDAHVWSARIETSLGHWARSLDEFRIALAERPNDVALWIEFGQAAESAGRYTVAQDAFSQAARLSPNSRDIRAAQQALENRQQDMRALLRDVHASPGPGSP
jgi:tetratricopeptide (TPR) repeat protein